MSFPAFVQYTFCFGILHISILWRKIILFKCQRFYSSFCCMKTCVHGNVAYQLISVTQSCLTLCNPMDLQHPRLPCPSLTLGACSNSCPLSWWCHPTISYSVIPFSSCLQSFPASGSWSFPMSQRFASGGQSIGVSASTSVLPLNTQDWSPLGWTGWMSMQPKGLSRVFSNTTNSSALSFPYSPTLTSIHDHWKNHSLD